LQISIFFIQKIYLNIGYIFLREKAKRNVVQKEPVQLEHMRIYKIYYRFINP
jgi:hypothetical protein